LRKDGRADSDLRAVKIERNYTMHAEGSVLVSFGNTKVLCNASFTPGVPRFKKDTGEGWVTAEYSMLPRAVVDYKALGENTIVIDCDVIQADGGTRTAAITGAFVALMDAVAWAKAHGHISKSAKPILDTVAAVSVGVVDGRALCDLAYEEDVRAETDMNIVATGRGLFVEVQGTAEANPFSKEELDSLLDMAVAATQKLSTIQREALANNLELA